MNPLNTNLPSGLIDRGVEFFEVDKLVNCLHDGRRYKWHEIPQWIKDIVKEEMYRNPDKIKALVKWDIFKEDEMLHQFILCNFGGFDNEPDISPEGKIGYTEYWDCGRRGVCSNEGQLCNSIKVKNGHITKRQIEVLKLIRKGYTNKEIADELFISEDTVSSHCQNIEELTGLKGKPELAAFAQYKHII